MSKEITLGYSELTKHVYAIQGKNKYDVTQQFRTIQNQENEFLTMRLQKADERILELEKENKELKERVENLEVLLSNCRTQIEFMYNLFLENGLFPCECSSALIAIEHIESALLVYDAENDKLKQQSEYWEKEANYWRQCFDPIEPDVKPQRPEMDATTKQTFDYKTRVYQLEEALREIIPFLAGPIPKGPSFKIIQTIINQPLKWGATTPNQPKP